MPAMLPASDTAMEQIAAARRFLAATTLPAKLPNALRAISAPCSASFTAFSEDSRARSSTIGNSIRSGGIL